ncbi:unnamed protein product [Gongylonema pulchrum]|uniref:EGF-like domain-containing protein n=1 Tax=Gongylonema pulchrum TaxID=637853 RepID=A0A3P7P3Q7_9BILA|nr:unnamed protein product [Gongylonema pulchrum]
MHGFRCLCTPCFYGDSCSEIDSRCRSAQRYNRTGTFMVKAGNEHQDAKRDSNFRDFLLVLLSSCSMLALVLVAIVYYRQKIAKKAAPLDPCLQNDFNARRLTKYSEQKPCLSACAGRNAEISYFECDRTIKTQTV